MKLQLSKLACALMLVSGGTIAVADPFYMDLGAAGGTGSATDADTYTGLANQWQIFADTTSTQYDTNGDGLVTENDLFTDEGDAVFTSLISAFPLTGPSAAPGDTEGLTEQFTGHAITMHWTNLEGYIDSITADGTNDAQVTQAYTGGIIDFYYQETIAFDFGNGVGAINADGALGTADNTGFDSGTKILTLELDRGTGSSLFSPDATQYITGSFDIFFDVTFALDDFWWFYGDKDFADLLAAGLKLTSNIDANTDNVIQTPIGGDVLFVVDSDHDGSVSFKVPVPGTVGLLGLGLLGMGGFAKRRKVK